MFGWLKPKNWGQPKETEHDNWIHRNVYTPEEIELAESVVAKSLTIPLSDWKVTSYSNRDIVSHTTDDYGGESAIIETCSPGGVKLCIEYRYEYAGSSSKKELTLYANRVKVAEYLDKDGSRPCGYVTLFDLYKRLIGEHYKKLKQQAIEVEIAEAKMLEDQKRSLSQERIQHLEDIRKHW